MKQALIITAKDISDAPTEFQVLPYGEISIEGEAPAVVDEESMDAIVADFDRRGNDMVIDYEHQTLKDMQAPAAGWIKKMVNRGKDGLWAVVEWTEKAKEYLKNREYRYFSPVFWLTKADRKVVKIENVALTNYPKMNGLTPIVNKLEIHKTINPQGKEDSQMIAKLRKLFGLADDAGEDKVFEAAEVLVANKTELETNAKSLVACKEVLTALDLEEGAEKTAVIAKIDTLKAPGDAAVELSRQVATLSRTINEMKRDDLVTLALKDGKTSPEELEKWGRDLAEKNPEKFEQIVLSRPRGSVIPVDKLPGKEQKADGQVVDDAVLAVAKMMGNSPDDIKKYAA